MILLKCELDDLGLLTAGHPAIACHLAPSRKPMAFPYVLWPSFLSDLAAHVLISLSPVLQPQHLLTLTYQNNSRLFCVLCLDHHPADTEWLPPSPPQTLLSDDTLLIIPIQTTLFTVSVPITPSPLTSFLFLCPHHSHFLTYFVVNVLYVSCTSFPF